jgi:hypothetical protein
MEDRLTRVQRTLLLLAMDFLAFSCSNDASGPDVTESPAVPPKVLSVSPANGSIGPVDQIAIVIEFNKSMVESSLRRAVSLLEPSTDAEIDTAQCWLSDAEHRHWTINGLHEVDHQVPTYRVGQRYRLQIGNVAVDMYGNHLAPFWYEFTPEPYFRLKALAPVESVIAWSTWDCMFNSPVDSSIFAHMQIDPPMDATWDRTYGTPPYEWTLIGRNLTPGQTYTLTITDGAHDAFGNAFQGTTVFQLAPNAALRPLTQP